MSRSQSRRAKPSRSRLLTYGPSFVAGGLVGTALGLHQIGQAGPGWLALILAALLAVAKWGR